MFNLILKQVTSQVIEKRLQEVTAKVHIKSVWVTEFREKISFISVN